MNSTKKQLIGGVLYTAIAKYAGIVISLLVSAILARLLSPDDFGVVAISLVFIAFFNILSDLGVGPAVIQHQNLTKDDLSNIFSFTIYGGVFIALVFFCLSWVIAAFYGKPILVYICQILSVNIFFASANIVPNSLLLKKKRFRFIAVRTLSIQIVCGVISIFAALNGGGIYSLLITPVITSIGVFIVNYLSNPLSFKWIIKIGSLKLIFTFSVYQFLSNFINFFSRNLDKLLIGKYINMHSLGYYDISYKLMLLPLQNITNVITPVIHPVFAEFQNAYEKLINYYLKIIRLLSFISFPLSVLLFFCAQELICIVFGDKWLDAIPVFKILTFSVGFQILLSTSGSILQAANATKALFVSGLLSAITNISGLIVSLILFNTIESVAWALVITFTFNFFVCFWILFCKVFKKNIFIFLKELASSIVITCILAIILFWVSWYITSLSNILSLLIKSSVLIVVLVLYMQIRKELDFISLVKNLRNKVLSFKK